MNTNRYVPASDSEKGIWLNNFTAKMSLYAAQLGVTPAELTALQKDNTAFQYIINTMETYRQFTLNLAGYKNMMKHAAINQHLGTLPVLPTLPAAPPMVPEGIFDRISKLVTRIKASVNYTDNIGNDLGVISPTSNITIATLQPDLKITLDVGRPHIKWIKGYSDALDLYVDRNDTFGFVLIGRLTRNEYLDIVSLPSSKVFDEWQYKGIYVIADTPIGLFSKVTSVVVKKMS